MQLAFQITSKKVLHANKRDTEPGLSRDQRRPSQRATEIRPKTRELSLHEAASHAHGGKVPFYLAGKYGEETLARLRAHLGVDDVFCFKNPDDFEKRDCHVAVLVTDTGNQPTFVMHGTRTVTVFH